MTAKTQAYVQGPDRTIPKPEGHIEIGGRIMVAIPIEEWERVVDTLQDYFDALYVEEMMDAPTHKSIPWEEARKRLFANQIKKVRTRKKVTQEELARRLGISQSRISRLEDPDNRPSPELYERVAKALKTSVEVLMRPDSP